jgi:hypothetical protein
VARETSNIAAAQGFALKQPAQISVPEVYEKGLLDASAGQMQLACSMFLDSVARFSVLVASDTTLNPSLLYLKLAEWIDDGKLRDESIAHINKVVNDQRNHFSLPLPAWAASLPTSGADMVGLLNFMACAISPNSALPYFKYASWCFKQARYSASSHGRVTLTPAEQEAVSRILSLSFKNDPRQDQMVKAVLHIISLSAAALESDADFDEDINEDASFSDLESCFGAVERKLGEALDVSPDHACVRQLRDCWYRSQSRLEKLELSAAEGYFNVLRAGHQVGLYFII